MAQNLASLVVTPAQQAAILAAVAQIEGQLQGLITLDNRDRRSIQNMGPKSDRFARGVVQVLEQNPALVPPGIDVVEAKADLDALEQLMPILKALQQLTRRVDHTVAALGSDAMEVATTGYAMLKLLGDDHGLADVRKELGYRFARNSKKPQSPND